jgi:hypothetical protein
MGKSKTANQVHQNSIRHKRYTMPVTPTNVTSNDCLQVGCHEATHRGLVIIVSSASSGGICILVKVKNV